MAYYCIGLFNRCAYGCAWRLKPHSHACHIDKESGEAGSNERRIRHLGIRHDAETGLADRTPHTHKAIEEAHVSIRYTHVIVDLGGCVVGRIGNHGRYYSFSNNTAKNHSCTSNAHE